MERINTPTVRERQEAFEKMVDEERKILLGKGQDYTAGKADEDAYHNFREIAKQMEGCPITPYTVAMVYALKHIYSLLAFCKTGKQESGEGLRGRHQDVRNYGFILNELVPDHMNYFEKQEPVADPARDWPNPVFDNDNVTYVWSSKDVHIPIRMAEDGTVLAVNHDAANQDIEDEFEQEWFDKIEIKGKEVRLTEAREVADNLRRENFNREVRELARKRFVMSGSAI